MWHWRNKRPSNLLYFLITLYKTVRFFCEMMYLPFLSASLFFSFLSASWLFYSVTRLLDLKIQTTQKIRLTLKLKKSNQIHSIRSISDIFLPKSINLSQILDLFSLRCYLSGPNLSSSPSRSSSRRSRSHSRSLSLSLVCTRIRQWWWRQQ